MSNQFPLGDKELKIGILGMSEGNAHPFSWSAMYNNYNKEEMDKHLKEVAERYPEIRHVYRGLRNKYLYEDDNDLY